MHKTFILACQFLKSSKDYQEHKTLSCKSVPVTFPQKYDKKSIKCPIRYTKHQASRKSSSSVMAFTQLVASLFHQINLRHRKV